MMLCMFGTGTRFAEYGLTGGFFILLQLLVLEWMFPGGAVYVLQFLATLYANIAAKNFEPIYPAIQSLLVALTLLSVFITGLLLDLIGAVLVMWEARDFRTHLLQNGSWVTPFIEAELPDYKSDYEIFFTLLDQLSPRDWWGRPESYAFWKWSVLRQAFRRAPIPISGIRKTQQAFRRLEAALIAKLVVVGVKTDFLSEQMSICRMSRAITFTIFITSLEVFCAVLYRILYQLSLGLELGSLPSVGRLFFVILPAPGITIFAGAFAIIIARAAYSRFCTLLFSQVYSSARLHARAEDAGQISAA
jgi:hypothetical protein